MPTDTSPAPAPTPKRVRVRVPKDPDVAMPPRAAELTGLRYPEQFNEMRWSLEEGVDPATGSAIPIPAHLRVPYRATAQIRKSSTEYAAYLEVKAERAAWTRAHWMRVPCWGGLATPNGEYRYAARLCRIWAARMRGENPADLEARS
jgi:hypothetical protein